jgi:N-acetylglucosaminyldiphosphoundecaprenol N-acetyl-beta-D-mannosaminyltransferase
MIMECFDDNQFKFMVNSSNLIVPDGKPLVWAQQLMGFNIAKQVRGPSLMLKLCDIASDQNISIGLYGSKKKTLNRLEKNLLKIYPGIKIVFSYSPPFRPLSKKEQNDINDKITKSKARIVFIGLGCPKQERWMFNNINELNCILIGVGAAFDFISGEKKESPTFLQPLGLEWLFRLLMEPKRLFWRYVKTIPRFIFYFTKQLLWGKRK